MSGPGFTVGHPQRESLQVTILGRAHPGFTDFWDGNWLRTPMAGWFGRFRFDIADAMLRADEIAAFAAGLAVLRERRSGRARLMSMEDWVDLTISGDGSGRLDVSGLVMDRPGGNELRFRIDDFDQSFLPPLLADLDEALAAYPVVGVKAPPTIT